jgi:hypothetical protein
MAIDTRAEVLAKRLHEAKRDERHRTVAETSYWCEQYKLLATDAIRALATEPPQPASAGPEVEALAERLKELETTCLEMAEVSSDAWYQRAECAMRAREALTHASSVRVPAPVEWQPIETAPKDRDIVVYAAEREGLPGFFSLCRWHPDAGFCVDELREPEWWAEPPAALQRARETGAER